MRSKTINKIIGAMLILTAFFPLASGGEYGYIVALMLFLDGVSCLLQNGESEVLQIASKTLRRISFVMAILLLVKIFIIG